MWARGRGSERNRDIGVLPRVSFPLSACLDCHRAKATARNLLLPRQQMQGGGQGPEPLAAG